MKPKEVLAFCREKDVKAVDLRFMDFPGLWQHFTIPVNKLDEDVFEDGLGFDGSSIRGWQAINESDMLVVPAAGDRLPRSVHHAPHAGDDLQHPGPDHPRGLQPRSRATSPARRSTISRAPASPTPATSAPRPSSSSSTTSASTRTRTRATTTSTASKANGTAAAKRSPNLGYKLRYKEGYFPVPPADQMMNIRNEMMQTMIECGMDVEAQHHEVATAGQSEIDLRFDDAGAHGRQDDDLQVHHQERRQQARQDRHLHAQAALRRQRLGHAHPHLAVEGGRRRCSPAAATPA